MLLEAVQILNTALVEQGLEEYAFYGATHTGHTTIEWVTESDGNFEYVLRLVAALNDEKQYRYDSGDHSSYEKVSTHWFEGGECILPLDFTESETPQPLASGKYESESSDPVQRYRDYYRDVKRSKDWFEYDSGRCAPCWIRNT